jgi:biotin carboxyl carrier protein
MSTDNHSLYHIEVNERQEFDLSPEEVEGLDMIVLNEREYHLIYNKKSYRIELEELNEQEPSMNLRVNGKPFQLKVDTPLARKIQELGIAEDELGAGEDVKAPMPGKVISVMVEADEEVEAGQDLLILEAMKMENVIKSNSAGFVQDIKVAEGDAVDKNDLLLQIEGNSED